jgi:hypothetical protein
MKVNINNKLINMIMMMNNLIKHFQILSVNKIKNNKN